MTETEKVGAVIVTAVKAAHAPLLEEIGRLKALVGVLEARALVPGDRGEKGLDGATGTDGQPGPAGPQGEKGEPGITGDRGEKGLDGTAGERGGDGQQGIPGRDGLPGVQGPAGEKGLNGLDGKDGAAGRDGTLENLKAVFDGERTVTFCFKDGTPIEGGVVKLAVPIYRGVYVAGKAYERGDSVTFGGSQWIAHEDTDVKPAEGKAWQLAVRAGRDGREGKVGPDGKQGPQGPQGVAGRDYR